MFEATSLNEAPVSLYDNILFTLMIILSTYLAMFVPVIQQSKSSQVIASLPENHRHTDVDDNHNNSRQ